MREGRIQSVAFRKAELNSERQRIFGVVGVLAIFLVITIVRSVIRAAPSSALSLWSLTVAVTLIGYELWMLSKVQRALRTSAMFSRRLGVLSTVVETSIPAFAIAFVNSGRVVTFVAAVCCPGCAVVEVLSAALILCLRSSGTLAASIG